MQGLIMAFAAAVKQEFAGTRADTSPAEINVTFNSSWFVSFNLGGVFTRIPVEVIIAP